MAHGDVWAIPRNYYEGWYEVQVGVDLLEVQNNQPDGFVYGARKDVSEWLRENIGPEVFRHEDWTMKCERHPTWKDLKPRFVFRYHHHAMLFKLTWGGR